MKLEVEHLDLCVNNVCLHLARIGEADGRLVILLHGFPDFWYGWRRQIPALVEAGFNVLAPDQRGYNISEKPPGVRSYQVNVLAQDIVELMDMFEREKAILVGHDWGGGVAWEIALRYPERLEKLVILNAPHPDVMTRFLFSSLEQLRRSWYIFFFQIPFLPEWLLRRNKFALLRRAVSSRRDAVSDESAELVEYLGAWSQPKALEAMLNWYRAAFRRGVRHLGRVKHINLRRVQVPTLMLWGEKDIALSRRLAQPSLNLCDQGRLVFYENASHWVQRDQAEAVNAELLDFLRS